MQILCDEDKSYGKTTKIALNLRFQTDATITEHN